MQNDDYTRLLSLCTHRQNTRSFTDHPVSNEMVTQILAIAETSPYAALKKNWEIRVINQPDLISKMASTVRQTIDRMARSIRIDLREGFLQYSRHFTDFESAPLLFLPLFRDNQSFSYMLNNLKESTFSPTQWEHENYIKSVSCVSMLILLAAESLGLGSCLMTGPLLAEKELPTILNIRKEWQIGAIIPVGYSAEPHL